MRQRFPVAAASPLSVYQKRAIQSSLNLALSKFNSFCTTTQTSLQCQEPDSLKKFSTSLTEDDDFSELGEPVIKNGFSSLKLMTEKRNRFLKPGRSKDVQKPGRSKDVQKPGCSKDVSPTKLIHEMDIKELFSTLGKPPKKVTAASKTNKNTRDQPHVKRQVVLQDGIGTSNSVAVENVPTSVSLSTVVEPPKHGVAASRTNENTRVQSHVALHGRSQNATLRILGLSHDTSLDMIHSYLKSVGCLEEIAIKDWGALHAVFRVKADSDLKDILDKLNGAIIDERRISADILHSHDNAAAAPLSRGKRNKMCLQVSSHLKELRNQFNLHALYAEDLYNLHLAIMHLESQSGTSISGSS